jgi:predicted Zn-dependent protease
MRYRLISLLGKYALLGFSVIISTFIFSGCTTEYNLATQRQEWIYYSTDKEIKLGKSISQAVQRQYKALDDPLVLQRVKEIGQKIAAVCDRRDIDYHFMVLDTKEENAFSLPGGFIYVNKGLLDEVTVDDELACVLGHEVGHIVARHSVKKLQAIMGYSLLRILATALPSSTEIGQNLDYAFFQILAGYSRKDELLADRLAVRYVQEAGYKPSAMLTFLEKLRQVSRRKPIRQKSYLKTHPYIPDRIRVVKQELGKGMSFRDYINIEEE